MSSLHLNLVNPKEFVSVVKTLLTSNQKLKDSLTVQPISEYKKAFLSSNRKTGFAISNSGEIINVFNIDPSLKGVLSGLIETAIKEGGTWANMFDSVLVRPYKNLGFKEVKREKNWVPGGPDVIWLSLNESENLQEVRMSPSAFSQGLVKAQDQGVLIGFEFEIIVPLKKSSDRSDNESIDSDWTKYQNINTFIQDWLEPRVAGFDKTKDSRIRSDHFEWMKAVTKNLLSSLSDDGLEKLLQLFHEIYDKDSISNMVAFVSNKPLTKLEKLLVDFLELEDYEETEDYQILDDHIRTVISVEKFITDVYGSINQFMDDFGLVYDRQGKGLFIRAAEEIQEIVSKEMAGGRTVHILPDYHVINKNLTDWYIEPDASVKPAKPSVEAGVEIVTPPLPPQEAFTALKRVYSVCHKYGYYTNKTTGIHINISIPKKIDVLKLAVFLGDQYVLETFGRQASDMAKSIMAMLKAGVQKDSIQNVELGRLQKLATYFADDHYTSVSYETNTETLKKNKYISFRHAGGDYLSNLLAIIDTIGRFVTVMVISADKNAHRNEYLKKLAKLVQRDETPNQTSQES